MKLLLLLLFSLSLFSCRKKTVHETSVPVVFPPPSQPIPPPTPAPVPGFVTLDAIEDDILWDQQNLVSDEERLNTRYFVGCDRFNQSESMATYKQAIDLGINRLSDQRFLTPSTQLGSAGCIFRIYLPDYGLTRLDWKLIEENTLLDFTSNTIRNQNIQFLSQTEKPWLFGIEFCAMFECDFVAQKAGTVYYSLTNQPTDLDEFYLSQGVNVQSQVDDEQAVFAGFSQSQIALGKSRIVAVYESFSGYVMTTYDTALNGDDIFANPFTIEIAEAGVGGYHDPSQSVMLQKVFNHAAQEHIYSNLNGLFGLYRLNNGGGTTESFAPANVVIDLIHARVGDPTIYPGSCGGCHYREVAIAFRDELNSHIIGNSDFNAREKLFADVFFNYDKIAAIIDEINRRNQQALAELGVDHSTDPLSDFLWAPIRKEMTADQIAAYTFLTTEEFLRRLRGAANSSRVFGNLINGGKVNLAILNSNFETLVEELNLYRDSNL